MEELALTSITMSDIPWMDTLLNDKEVRRFLPNLSSSAYLFLDEMNVAENRKIGKLWAIRLNDNGVGFIAIYDLEDSPFIFYAMLPMFRNRGYMKRCVKMIEMEYKQTLYTCIEKENVATQHVLSETNIIYSVK